MNGGLCWWAKVVDVVSFANVLVCKAEPSSSWPGRLPVGCVHVGSPGDRCASSEVLEQRAHQLGTFHNWHPPHVLPVPLSKIIHEVKVSPSLYCLIVPICVLTEFYLLSLSRQEGSKAHCKGLNCNKGRDGGSVDGHKCLQRWRTSTLPQSWSSFFGCDWSWQWDGSPWCSSIPRGTTFSGPLSWVNVIVSSYLVPPLGSPYSVLIFL